MVEKKSRSKYRKLATNTFSSLLFQIVTIICGVVVPRIIIKNYGSEISGLINSITQFLGVIGLLELGVGSVTQSALYKPLLEKDVILISKIYQSASFFYKRIGYLLVIYVLVLMFTYPFMVNQNFGYLYTLLLIFSMSISVFAQYFFGIVNRLLLTADQRGYIQYNAQTISLILNTLSSVMLIRFGFGIHAVKLATSVIYLIQPIIIQLYVGNVYSINKHIKYSEEPISQKWNGIAQHIASFVLSGTDIIVLTIFSSLINVSIYNVYFMVVSGVKVIVESLAMGIRPLLGELYAASNMNKLNEMFEWFQWAIHTGATFLFGCTLVLILPFVRLYTSGVEDVNYIRPIFSILITLAYLVHCYRIPYMSMIFVTGSYKQTQHSFFIASGINIIISIITVSKYGLVGVAIGTLIAMLYQTVWMAYYNARNIIHKPNYGFIKHIIVDFIVLVVGYNISKYIRIESNTVLSWLVLAFKVVHVWLIVIFCINILTYRKMLITIRKLIINMIYKKNHKKGD